MKIFEVKKGTRVLLSNDNTADSIEIISKCDIIFDREDIITDPVSYHNEFNKKARNGGFETNGTEIVLQILGEGYFKFKLKKGIHTKTDYKYAYVNANDVVTM